MHVDDGPHFGGIIAVEKLLALHTGFDRTFHSVRVSYEGGLGNGGSVLGELKQTGDELGLPEPEIGRSSLQSGVRAGEHIVVARPPPTLPGLSSQVKDGLTLPVVLGTVHIEQ